LSFTRYFPTAFIKKIEIIRGTGSGLYGSNAFLGVVKITTLDDWSEISLETGSNNAMGGQFILSEQDNYTFGLEYYDDEGDKYSIQTLGTRDPKKHLSAFGKLSYKNFLINLTYTETQFSDFVQFDQIANGINEDNTRQLFFNIQYEKSITDNLDWYSNASFSKHRWDAFVSLIDAGVDTGAGPLPAPFMAGPSYDNRAKGFDTRLSYTMSDSHKFITGLSYNRNGNEEEDHPTNYADLSAPYPLMIPIAPFYLGEVRNLVTQTNFGVSKKRTNTGLFIQLKSQLSENWSSFAGIRNDHYSDFGNAVSPRLSLLYRVNDNSMLKFVYGHAFRAPNFSELHLDSPVGIYNKDIKPEENDSLEINYQYITDKLLFSATVFNYQLTNPIILGPAPDGRSTWLNGSKDTVNGLELEIKWEANDNLLISASLSDNHGDMSESSYPSTATVAIDYSYNSFNWHLSGNCRSAYRSAVPEQRGYCLLRTKLSYQLSAQDKLSLTVENLTDKEYLTNGQNFILNNNSVPGRGLGWSLKYSHNL